MGVSEERAQKHINFLMRKYWRAKPDKYEAHKAAMRKHNSAEAFKIEQKAKFAMAKETGLCPFCFTNPAINRSYCRTCQDHINEYYRERRVKAKREGLCSKCFKIPKEIGFLTCTVCRDKQRVKKGQLPHDIWEITPVALGTETKEASDGKEQV